MRLASSHFPISPSLAYNTPFGLYTPLLFVHSTALPARLSLCNGMCSPTASSMSQTRIEVGAIGEAVNEPGQVYLSSCAFPASCVVLSFVAEFDFFSASLRIYRLGLLSSRWQHILEHISVPSSSSLSSQAFLTLTQHPFLSICPHGSKK
jgi:hypothetical protein